jgi:hypothetical protein
MSETIKSLATLLGAVRGLNEDKRALEQYAAKKVIDMKLETDLYEKKLADKTLRDTVANFSNAEAAVLSGQAEGKLEGTGDTLRTIKKKKYGTQFFAATFGIGGIAGKGRLQEKRFGKRQVDAVGEALKGYGQVFNEARKAELNQVTIQKNPEIVRQLTIYQNILDQVEVDKLPTNYQERVVGQKSLLDTYLGS